MNREESSDNEDKVEKDEEAFESFGAPVYGPSNIISPGLNGKSAYSYPVPPVSSLQGLPANYLAYLTALGVGNPYAYGPYNRYGVLPYTASSLYGYGTPLLGNLGSNILPGYAGYGSPYLGRSVLSGAYPGYPGFLSSLGYRYGAFPYPAMGGIKSGAAALTRAQAAGVGVPVPVPRVPAIAAGVPAPIAGISGPIPGVPAPVAPYPAPAPGAPYPFNGIPPYRPLIRPVQGKDGIVRYTATNV